ncbi:MAG: TIGR02597 family protein [Opitutaceae bacterium]
MKTYLKPLFLFSGCALAAISTLNAGVATPVTTDPVGYVTVTINGTGGVASEAFTYMGAPLHAATSTAGALDTSAANTLTDSSQTWTVDAYAGNYVLITSGTNEGVSATIASNTATALTTVEDLDSLLAGDETFEIRSYTTIGDLFGAANEAGLDGGSGAGNADNILLQDGAGGFDTYYYKDSGIFGGTGWRSSASNSIDESGAAIPFGSGAIVVRRQSADIDLVISGAVFGGDATSPVEAGFNWMATAIPVDVTLAGLFGAANEAGLDGGSGAGNADNILVQDGSGGFDIYYYKDAGIFGGTGWRSSASNSVDESAAVVATPGQMFLINRSGGAGINLTETSPL